MQAREQKLDTILRTSRLHSYMIPRYQREYRWKAERWGLLYDDIQQNESGYFIGALIFIKASQSDHGEQKYEVVDGQQRLATLSIALAAIYRSTRERIDYHEKRKADLQGVRGKISEKIGTLTPKITELQSRPNRTTAQEANLAKKQLKKLELQNKETQVTTDIAQQNKAYQELIGIKQPIEEMLLINDQPNNLLDVPRVTLSSQKDDNAHYLNVLKFSGVLDRDLPAANLPTNLGDTKRTRIGKCFQFFYSKFSRTKDVSSSDLVQYYRQIADLTVVDIKATTAADAYVLFESLNNRGEPLTGLDLIKNQILASIEEDSKQNPRRFAITLDAATTKWQQFIGALPEPRDQDKFLRHLYLAFKKQQPEFYLQNFDKVTGKTVVGEVYPALIKKDAEKLLNHFHLHAPLYAQIVNPSKVTETSIRRAFTNVQNVEAVPARILLLFLLKNFSTRREEILPHAADHVLKFFIRRHLTDDPKTRDLDGIFVELTEKLTELGAQAASATVLSTIETHLAQRVSTIDRILAPLRGDVGQKSAFARVLLNRIEVKSRPPDNVPDLWAVEGDGRPTFTLEHILPQGELSPTNWWRTHLSPGNPGAADEIQDVYCQKLGNLTLTGFNQELSNNPFPEKRDYLIDNQPAGYKNGLILNEYPKDKTEWKTPQVEERTELLVKKLVPHLLFPGETEPNYAATPPPEAETPLPTVESELEEEDEE